MPFFEILIHLEDLSKYIKLFNIFHHKIEQWSSREQAVIGDHFERIRPAIIDYYIVVMRYITKHNPLFTRVAMRVM